MVIKSIIGATCACLAVVSFSADAGQLAVSSFPRNSVLEFDLDTRSPIQNYYYQNNIDRTKGVAYRGDGTIYVTSLDDNIEIFDVATGAHIRRLDTGNDSYWYKNPEDLAFSPDGRLYASVDFGSNNPGIWVFDLDTGEVLDTFGSGAVRGMTFGSDGSLYAANYYSNNSGSAIKRYDPSTGALLSAFDSTNIGGLHNPSGITTGPDGLLYVADFSMGSILRYDPLTEGFVDEFISSSTSLLSAPYDLEFDSNGYLYVSDWSTEKVQIFNANGVFIDTFADINSGSINGLTYIDINQVPIPAAVWLFGSGLLGLIGVARRKKA